MSDPSKAPDNPQTSVSDNTDTGTDSGGDSTANLKNRVARSLLLLGLLVALLIFLITRGDLRQSAAESSENAMRYVAFDMVGWSPRDVFIWRLSVEKAGMAAHCRSLCKAHRRVISADASAPRAMVAPGSTMA